MACQEYVLTCEQVRSLFSDLSERMRVHGCNHTRRFTLGWLDKNIPEEKRQAVLRELDDMGGLCDCEVLANAYEDYDLE